MIRMKLGNPTVSAHDPILILLQYVGILILLVNVYAISSPELRSHNSLIFSNTIANVSHGRNL